MAVLEGSDAGSLFEDAVEILVGRESVEGDGVGEGVMIGGVALVAEDGLCMLDAVARYVLGEAESGSSVDAVADVGAVAIDRCREVLDGQFGIGEQLLLAHGCGDLMHQFVSLGGSCFVLFGLFLL